MLVLYRACVEPSGWGKALGTLAAAFGAGAARLEGAAVEADFHAGGLPAGPDDFHHRLVLALDAGLLRLILGRSAQAGPFGAEDRAAAERIGLEVRRALALEGEPRQDSLLSNALDAFRTPCLGLGAGGQLIFANRAAENLLAEGRLARLDEGRIVLSDRLATIDFLLALERALADNPQPAELTLRGAQAGPGAILVLTPSWIESGPVLLYVIEAKPPAPDRAAPFRLMQIFDFTESEAEVAIELMRGRSVQDIASARRVSLATVRSQLRMVLHKTHSTRQSDLFQLQGLLGP